MATNGQPTNLGAGADQQGKPQTKIPFLPSGVQEVVGALLDRGGSYACLFLGSVLVLLVILSRLPAVGITVNLQQSNELFAWLAAGVVLLLTGSSQRTILRSRELRLKEVLGRHGAVAVENMNKQAAEREAKAAQNVSDQTLKTLQQVDADTLPA